MPKLFNVLKIIVVQLIFGLLSCTTVPIHLPSPVKPLEPHLTWVHAPAQGKLPAGELLNYEGFRMLALWIVETRAYQSELENQLEYYKKITSK